MAPLLTRLFSKIKEKQSSSPGSTPAESAVTLTKNRDHFYRLLLICPCVLTAKLHRRQRAGEAEACESSDTSKPLGYVMENWFFGGKPAAQTSVNRPNGAQMGPLSVSIPLAWSSAPAPSALVKPLMTNGSTWQPGADATMENHEAVTQTSRA